MRQLIVGLLSWSILFYGLSGAVPCAFGAHGPLEVPGESAPIQGFSGAEPLFFAAGGRGMLLGLNRQSPCGHAAGGVAKCAALAELMDQVRHQRQGRGKRGFLQHVLIPHSIHAPPT